MGVLSIRKKIILYVGGFQLPDKNAAALRVVANAKALRDIGYEIFFVNALIDYEGLPKIKIYEGFTVYEYKRESQNKFLFSSKRIRNLLRKTDAKILIAYNYPAIALNNIRKYCRRNGIKCYADSTEWYVPTGNVIFRLIKGFDTELRMRYVQPKMDGVIAISEYLHQYYKGKVKTVKIPPLVDRQEDKWSKDINCKHKGIKLIYAGSPSAQKEKLNVIVNAVEHFNYEQLQLEIVGLTKEQYNKMYRCNYQGQKAVFYGRVSNLQAIQMTKKADWVIVLREDNKVVKAGFPTKISEAVSCGTPIIANRFSNIDEYLDECNSILIDNIELINDALNEAIGKNMVVDNSLFDYRNYISQFQLLFEDKGEILEYEN